MRLKKPKNSLALARLMLWALLLVCTPLPAHAYYLGDPTPDPIDYNGYDPYSGRSKIIICPNDDPSVPEEFGFTRRLIPCIRDNILNGVNNVLGPFTDFIAYAVQTACLLAVVLYGALMVTGKTTIMRDGAMLAIKVTFVTVYTMNFASFFQIYLTAMDSMLGVVGGYAVFNNNWNCPLMNDPPDLMVWDNVDCLIETLVGGIFSPFTLSGGILGFLVSCLLSNATGILIALMGGYLIIQLLFALARSLYIFITAYIAVSIMVLVSPIFIPMMLFRATIAYFEKWFKMTLSFMIQPVVLFAYLAMLIIAADYVIFTGPLSLYRAVVTDSNLTGITVDDPDFNVAQWDGGIGGLGGWLMDVGAYGEQSQGANGVSVDVGKVWKDYAGAAAGSSLGQEEAESVQTGVLGELGQQIVDNTSAWRTDIFNYLGIGSANDLKYFKVDFPTTAIDWQYLAYVNDDNDYLNDCPDPSFPMQIPILCTDPTSYLIRVFISMMMALVTGYIFMIMLDYMPYISSGMAGMPIGIPTFGKGRMAPPGSGLMDSAKSKMMSLAGLGK